MKLGTTLLVLVLVVLGAWGIIRWLGEPPGRPPARVPLVPEELLAGWEEIDLDLLSEQGCRLVREPGAVMLRFGSNAQGERLLYRDPADLEHVEKLLQGLRDSWREPLVGSADDLLRAGLDPPRFHVVIRGGGRELKLGFGNDDPTGQGVLARSFTDSTVFRTGPQVPNLLKFNLRDWRSKTIFGFDPMTVTRIDLVKYPPPDQGGEAEVLSVVREGPRSWRIAEPRSLMADPQACLSLAQRASLLKVESFVSQEFTKQISAITHLPDEPSWSVQVSVEPALLELDVGACVSDQGYACRLRQRDENMVFAVQKAQLDAILDVTVDSLRPRRLFPHVETRLVGLALLDRERRPRWSAEREGRHPHGAWLVEIPFQARANEGKGGKGSGSFAQIVADVDRTEVDAFLPPGTPFEPEAVVALRWKDDPIVVDKELEIARDPEHQRTLVRVRERPDELFAVDARLGALIDLDLELYRDRTIFPTKEEFLPKLTRWRLSKPGREPIEVERREGQSTVAVGSTPQSLAPDLTSAAAELYGRGCAGYVRAKEVMAAAGGVDPFATVALELVLATADGREERLVVSGAAPSDQSPDGLYCRLLPRLPEDVWIVVPRPLLERLLRLVE